MINYVATRFGIWATWRLKEYIVKGFARDDERLKNPPVTGYHVTDCFDDLLARIARIIHENQSKPQGAGAPG